MLSNQPYTLSRLGFDDTKPWGNTQRARLFFPHLASEFNSPTDSENVGEVFLFSPIDHGSFKTFITESITTTDYFSYWHGLSDSERKPLFDCGRLTASISHYSLVPLFAKVIFANEPLSIQLHDENHKENGVFIPGKTEAWIALEDQVELLVGFKQGMKESFIQQLSDFRSRYTTIEEMKAFFNFYTLNKGDSFLISPGTVHAILKGSIYEIQQPCNITKRLLDIEKKAPRACDFNLDRDRDRYLYDTYFDNLAQPYTPDSMGHYHFDTPYFATQALSMSHSIYIEDSFSFLFCSKGRINLSSHDIDIQLHKGDVALIPANYTCHIEPDHDAQSYLSYLPSSFQDPFH